MFKFKFILIQIKSLLGKHEEALKSVKIALSIDPQNSDSLYRKAECLKFRKQIINNSS
ncbi:unnamed protein product [Paramecium sonneborni]|uniref:Tetratricopeptide repeat protein n=1 Tax=Paramecium sonneborni TaxID=65129 RepID=A0A8S1RHF1_9CILI|nr:unnamed protein product [Paramecium sonneborni]